jgi:hypothetical protein
MNNYFGSYLWRSITNYLHLGSRKIISTRDNTITPMWTNGMSYLYETQMKKSGMFWIMVDIDGGMNVYRAATRPLWPYQADDMLPHVPHTPYRQRTVH